MKNPRLQTITYGPFSGGINRAVARDKLSPNELYEACGVTLDKRGDLTGIYENDFNGDLSGGLANHEFPNVLATYNTMHVPYRVIYWPEDGKLWQLYGSNSAGATSIRRQDVDRSYGTYAATACIYQGWMILCGTGQQALAVHDDYSCNRTVTITSATYTTGTGVVSSITFGAGSIENVIVGDIVRFSDGQGKEITAVNHSGGTFTIATGAGGATLVNGTTIERFRPVRLGYTYLTDGTVTVTNGSKTVTGASTAFTADMVGSYITVCQNATTWSRPYMDKRSYKIAAYTSATEITLEDEYEGTTGSTLAYRVDYDTDATVLAQAPLQISQPFVYKDRLFGVGADPNAQNGAGNYNFLYFAGDTEEEDIFDFMVWDQDTTEYPIGINAGAIQRCVPLVDRCVVFLQNAVYELRGDVPPDPAFGSDLADRPLTDKTGLTTYDAVDVGPDGQTLYFGSPDGLFRIYGAVVEPIDQKIRDHELYRTGMQWVCYFDNKIYCTDGEEYPSYALAGNTQSTMPLGYSPTVRWQTPPIWILDLPSSSWTYTQRIYGKPTNDTEIETLYSAGLHGGIFNPYRGDFTNTERLYFANMGIMQPVNHPDNVRGDRYYHASTIVTPSFDGGDYAPKKIRSVRFALGNNTTNTHNPTIVLPANDPYAWTTSVISRELSPVHSATGYRLYTANGAGGRGETSVPVCIGDFNEYVALGTHAPQEFPVVNYVEMTTANRYVYNNFAAAASYTVDRIEGLLYLASTDSANPFSFSLMDSSRNSLALREVHADFDRLCNTNGNYYWFSVGIAPVTLTAGTTYKLGIYMLAGTIRAATNGTANRYSYDGVTESSLDSNAMVIRAVRSNGAIKAIDSLSEIAVDYLPLPGRKR
jgi:hypothetical protein